MSGRAYLLLSCANPEARERDCRFACKLLLALQFDAVRPGGATLK